MDQQTNAMERPIISTADTQGGIIRRCQRYGMGVQLENTNGPRLLEQSGSATIHQLEGTSGSLSSYQNLPSQEYQPINPDGQHNITKLHQQTRRNSLGITNAPRNQPMETLSGPRLDHNSQTHSRNRKHPSESRITTPLLQESMANPPFNIPNNSTTIWIPRRRSICRSHDITTSKVRILATRSGRVYHPMDPIQQPMDQSTLESNNQVLTQDSQRAPSSSHHCDTSLAIQPLLPSPPAISNTTTNSSDTARYSNDSLANAESITEKNSMLSVWQVSTRNLAHLNK